MNVNEINVKKTALLFFDMLNVYYHGATEEKKTRMRPAVTNAVRLLESARKARLPVFYAMANHRRDGRDSLPGCHRHGHAATALAQGGVCGIGAWS